MRWYGGYRRKIEKITFQKLLTISVICMISVVFVIFGLLVTWLSERKIRENVKNNMSIVVEQFDVYLNNYIENIYRGFRAFESDQSIVNLQISSQNERYLSYTAANYIYVKKLFTQFLNANAASVYGVYINFNDGRVGTQAYETDLLKINYTYNIWKKCFPENKYYWIDADYCRDLVPDREVGVVLFHLYEDENTNRTGIILVAIKEEFLRDILDVAELDQDAGMSLITDYGIMHFGNLGTSKAIDTRYDYLKESARYWIKSEILDGYYCMYKNMAITDWKLVYTVKESSISNAHYIFRDVMISTLLMIAGCALLLRMLSSAISSPLRELTRKVEKKDVLEHEISVSSYAEINLLSYGLEQMRQRINHLLAQVKAEQESKRQIEIALMQEQVNPHFLYNTLYSIMQLCEMGKPEKASQMLEALATFYRIGLNEGKNIITVQEELEHIKNYLFIQHFRYSDLFDYTIDCEPEILNCRIPKMSLQPLVENAIYHGIKQKHEFGNICIMGGSYDGVCAYLEVHDDGPGISEKQLQEIRVNLQKRMDDNTNNAKNFGMKNVDARIKFEFGEKFGLEIYSEVSDTCVRIRFEMKEE